MLDSQPPVDLSEFELTVPVRSGARSNAEVVALTLGAIAVTMALAPWGLEVVRERVDGVMVDSVAGGLRGWQFISGQVAMVLALLSVVAGVVRRWSMASVGLLLALTAAGFTYIMMPTLSGVIGSEADSLRATWGLPYFNLSVSLALLFALISGYGVELKRGLVWGLTAKGDELREEKPSRATVTVAIGVMVAMGVFLLLASPDDKRWTAMIREWF